MKQVTWGITLDCNLNCSYCYQKKDFPKIDIPLEKVREEFKKIGHIEFFSITGGEPLLIKNLAEIINMVEATSKTIFTNTTLVTQDFLDKIYGNIKFIVGYHYSSRVEFENFIQTVEMMEKRFPVTIVAILHPNLSKDFICNLTDKFKQRNKVVRWKPFIGLDKKILYPNSDYLNEFKESWGNEVKPLIDDKCKTNWKGQLCRAGKDLIYIATNGDVFRCVSEKVWGKRLGNFFNGDPGILTEPKICEYDVCKCYYQGQRYAI